MNWNDLPTHLSTAAMPLPYERPVIKPYLAGVMNPQATRTAHTPVTHIDGVAVNDLVARYGSPCFVLSERTIRRTQRAAYAAFAGRYPDVRFAWSYKTNYLDAVCRVFHQEGSWAEVVSGFEYEKARRNGIEGSRIFFNGPDKSIAALERAVQEHANIHVDHLDELYRIIDIATRLGVRANVAVRVNMDVQVYPRWDRFGFAYENGAAWDAITRIADNRDALRLVGLHCHIGTYMMTAEPYKIAATKMALLTNSVRGDLGIPIEYIDMGGGFASNNTLKGAYLPAEDTNATIDEYAEAITQGLLSTLDRGHGLPTLVLETGRFLIDDAGSLIATVIANKRLVDGRKATIVDVGVHLLFTSFWYKHRISPAQPFGEFTEDSVLYGPLCMNIDVVHEACTLPPLLEGDKLVIHSVGAYNMTQWMQFINMRPAVVMAMENGAVEMIRRAETIDDLTSLESIPQSLR
jgi:diaminopimelate decarboxylase